jgi:iron-sulfur cluster repair protein YtfE (RIC family)
MNDTPLSYKPRPSGIAAQLTVSQTVNATTTAHPETLAVFAEYGLDSCCGGARTLEAAAADAGIEVTTLMEALERSLQGREAESATPPGQR